MDSSLELVNVIDSCVILVWDLYRDYLPRSKTWLEPAEGKRRTVVIRLERICWLGNPFTSAFGNHCIYVSESGSPAFALTWGKRPFSSMSLAPPQSYTSLWQEVHCTSKGAKLNHDGRISTHLKLVHLLKIYTGWQKVKCRVFLLGFGFGFVAVVAVLCWFGVFFWWWWWVFRFLMNHTSFGVTVLSLALWVIVPDVKRTGAQRCHRWISINKYEPWTNTWKNSESSA